MLNYPDRREFHDYSDSDKDRKIAWPYCSLKTLSEQAGINAKSLLDITSPRKGVVVIISLHDEREDRIEKLLEVENQIADRAKTNPWPKGSTADTLLQESKDARADDNDAF